MLIQLKTEYCTFNSCMIHRQPLDISFVVVYNVHVHVAFMGKSHKYTTKSFNCHSAPLVYLRTCSKQ